MFVCCLWWRKRKHSFSYKMISLCCLSWSKAKDSFCCQVIFCMLSMMEPGKKLILFKHYFLHVTYDGAREKTHSFLTLFFLCSLLWSKRKIWFFYSIVFFYVLYYGAREKTHSLTTWFFYVFYDRAKGKSDSVKILFFVSCLWCRKRNNSVCQNLIFCMFSMMEEEKKLFLL